jgi:hypothetical protein
MNKKALSQRVIRTKFITPALQKAGWDVQSQIREEVSFTKGRIIVRGKLGTRGKAKRADYILLLHALNYNLNFKNPRTVEEDRGDPVELLARLEESEVETTKLQDKLRTILAEALLR